MKNINKYIGYLLLSAYMLIMLACDSSLAIEELEKSSEEVEQKLDELKEERKEKEQVIAEKEEIKKIINEFWNKVYSPIEELLFGYVDYMQDQDYIERGGEVLYLALKGRHREYIQVILNLNNKHLGITPEITLNKERLVGYALCRIIKDMEFNLKDVFEIITTWKEFESITQIQSIDEYIAMSWIEAIRSRNGSLIRIWKKRLKALCAVPSPQEDYHDFNKIVHSLIWLLKNDKEQKLAFSIQDFEECFRYVEFSNEQLELLANSENLTKEAQQHLPNLIRQYKKSKEKLNACTPIQRRHNQLSISKKREQNEYSDSEEEDAPHFNGVYNLTKSRAYGISDDMDDTEDYLLEDYLLMEGAGEVVNNYVMRRDEIYPDKLKRDAEYIHSGLPQQVTVLCTVLQQQDGRTKKFVFTNECSLSQWQTENLKRISTKAHILGYHVIMSQGSHAEGGLMQFLQERPTRYTHIIALGCSQPHCEFCYDMLKKFMGVDFKLEDISTSDWQIINKPKYYWCFPKALAYFCRENVCFPSLPKEVLEHTLSKMRKENWDQKTGEERDRQLNLEEWRNRFWKNHEQQEMEAIVQLADDSKTFMQQSSRSKSLKRDRSSLEEQAPSQSTSKAMDVSEKKLDLKRIKKQQEEGENSKGKE